MVDAHALGACGLGRAGSTPASPTRLRRRNNDPEACQDRHGAGKVRVVNGRRDNLT